MTIDSHFNLAFKSLEVVDMLKHISFRDNFVFFFTALINSSICYCFFGITGAMLGVLTVLFANTAYSAKKGSNNIFYTGFLLFLIVLAGGIGFLLKLSLPFYLFLFVVSYFYYVSYDKDIVIDRITPFIVIFACMGTTLPTVTIELPLAYLTGICISLILLTLLQHKKYDVDAFKRGLFSKELYRSDKRLGLRAFIYSIFLFLSLAIPDYLDLYRVYWAPLTFIVLLQPKEVGIIKITLSRFLGSVLGALFVFSLFHLRLFDTVYFDVILIAIVTFLMPTFLKLNYVFKTFAITVFVLLLIEETEYWGDPTYLLPYSRVYETLIGGSVALCASFVLKQVRRLPRIA